MSQRGRPFEPGNKFGRGRPRGSRNRVTTRVKELLEGHADSLARKLLLEAMQGNMLAMKLCIERLMPVPRDQPVRLGSMRMGSAAEVAKASEALIKKVASGAITPTEAQRVCELIETRRRAIESADLEKRLDALEQKPAGLEP
jgi:hypothetical protein